MQNDYSTTWFATFLAPLSVQQTEHEVAFLMGQLPNPPYTSIIDLCCGPGRHARRLATQGYRVLGIDRNSAAIEEARRQATPNASFVVRDMRALAELPGTYDAIICLWQSFGYFDAATNRTLLQQMARTLRAQGRLILDLYHRDFFAAHQGMLRFAREGTTITEEKRMVGRRLQVRLHYESTGQTDAFDWEVYTPEEISALAADEGLSCVLTCSQFDAQCPASSERPRMQLVFEKQ